jgi:hypothetical protein
VLIILGEDYDIIRPDVAQGSLIPSAVDEPRAAPDPEGGPIAVVTEADLWESVGRVTHDISCSAASKQRDSARRVRAIRQERQEPSDG